ncbi:ASCH domain-containing protein [bacterium]|nr:ASCH domain-containing protein [bacterium]
MVLGFTKTFVINGKRKPTGFEEKIKNGSKKHTIRWDDKDRWKLGSKIHCATGVRTPQYNCFHETDCKGIQKIKIEGRAIYVDGTYLFEEEIETLALNDGFDSVEEFWIWFDQYNPFIGKIIHWSNLLY